MDSPYIPISIITKLFSAVISEIEVKCRDSDKISQLFPETFK